MSFILLPVHRGKMCYCVELDVMQFFSTAKKKQLCHYVFAFSFIKLTVLVKIFSFSQHIWNDLHTGNMIQELGRGAQNLDAKIWEQINFVQ